MTAPRSGAGGQTLVIEDFPRPEIARTLSPNGRAHWAAKRKARINVIDHVTVAALGQHLRNFPAIWLVVLSPTFIYPDHRRRDDDNLATGVMKAVRDCLVNGGWLEADDTDHLKQMPVEVRVEKGRRALELRFEGERP
ncbi:MAG TPA: hypothetical protein VIU62_12735 [Chloroflexota bacterium]